MQHRPPPRSFPHRFHPLGQQVVTVHSITTARCLSCLAPALHPCEAPRERHMPVMTTRQSAPQLVQNLRWSNHIARSSCTFLYILELPCLCVLCTTCRRAFFFCVLLCAAPPCSIAKFAPIDDQFVLILSNLQRVPSFEPNDRYIALQYPSLRRPSTATKRMSCSCRFPCSSSSAQYKEGPKLTLLVAR